MSEEQNTFLRNRNIEREKQFDNNNNNNNEDDDLLTKQLLEQQQQFLKSGEVPSAKVHRGIPPPTIASKKKETILLDQQQLPKQQTTETATTATSTTSNTPQTDKKESRFRNKFSSNIKSTTVTSSKNNIPIIEDDVEKDIVSLKDDDDSAILPPPFVINPNAHRNEEEDLEKMVDSRDQHITSVITKIYERDVTDSLFEAPKKKSTSFPVPVHRSFKSFGMKSKDNPMDIDSNNNNNSSNNTDRESIDKENQEKIKAMSEKEILESQEYLMKHLDPSLVEKLKARRKQQQEQQGQIKSAIDSAKSKNDDNKRSAQLHPIESILESLQKQQDAQVKPMDLDDSDEETGSKKKKTKLTPQEQLQAMMDSDMPDWMKDLTGADASKQTFKESTLNFPEWRFDFNGNVIQRGKDIPTHMGLHHHGEEAAEAGYTIIELIQLSKSTNIGQASVSLKTLTSIIQKIHSGYYPIKKSNLFKDILKLKLPRLLRTIIDSKVPTILSSALGCLHALIVPVAEEAEFEMIESRCHRAMESIAIKPKQPPKIQLNNLPNQQQEGGEEYVDDDEKCVRDLVDGLVEMGLLNRLRFLLTHEGGLDIDYRSRASLILDILLRMARHSSEIAEQIVKCHYLVDVMKDSILKKDDVLLKVKTIRLIRRLCQTSRTVAVQLFSTPFSLFDFIKQYWANTTTDQSILLESCKLFRVMVIYHINLNYFIEFISTAGLNFVNQFTEYINQYSYEISNNNNTNSNNLDNIRNNQFLQIVRSIYNILDSLLFTFDLNNDQSSLIFDKISSFVEPAFIASHTLSVIYHSFKEIESKFQTFVIVGLHSSIIHFISSYFSIASSMIKTPLQLSKLQTKNATNQNNTLQDLIEGTTVNLFESIFGTSLYQDMKKKVLSLLPSQSNSTDNNNNTDTIHRYFDGEVCEWWLSITRYLLISIQQNRTIAKMIFHLDKADFFVQLHYILVSTVDYKSIHFEEDRNLLLTNNRSKTYLYYYLLKLMNELRFESDDFDPTFSKFHHSSSMSLVQSFLPNDDILLFDILQTVTLHPDYLSMLGCTKVQSVSTILMSFYQEKFLPKSTIEYSKQFQATKETIEYIPQSLMISFETYDSLLPLAYDWYNTPFQYLYNESQQIISGKNREDDFGDFDDDEDEMDAEIQPLIENNLLFIQSLYNTNSEYILSIPLENVYQHLMMVFLVKNEPWSNNNISTLMTQLFNGLIGRLYAEKKENEDPIVEFDFIQYFGDKFYQFLTDFIANFLQSSFSSDIYSTFVWVFLRQFYPAKFRKLIWNELFSAPQYLSAPSTIGAKELPLGDAGYMQPIESDIAMIQIYKNAIVQSKVTKLRAPILYKIAKHHLIHYIFSQNNEELLKNTVNVEIIKDILLSSTPDSAKDVLIDSVGLVGGIFNNLEKDNENRKQLLYTISNSDQELLNVLNKFYQ